MKKHFLPILTTVILLITVFTLTFASAYAIGDVDGDGKITASDARKALRASVNLDKLTAEEERAADVDGKPGVSAADARLILRASVNLETLKDPHTHSFTGKITKEATCTQDGVKTFSCTCGEGTYTEKIPATGHSYDKGVITLPTCTKDGYTTYTCANCNHSYKDATVKAKGHTEVTDAAVSPTCTKTGLTAGKHCSVCGTITLAQKTVAAKGHTEVTDAAVSPTCTKTGLTAGKHCSVCGTITLAQKTVAAKGHTEVTDAAVSPTCTKTGLTAGKHCSVCGTVIIAQTTVNALGHNKIPHAAKAPTCTEIGWDAYETCSRCDYTTYVEKSALGHDETEHEAKSPTCTEIGWDAYVTCSRCDYTTYAEKEALGHTETVVPGTATCTEAGLSESSYCSVCEETIVEAVEVDALGHDEVPHDAKTPTCSEIGWNAYVTCSRCDYTTYVEKSALGHDEIEHEAKAPTCTEIGWDAYVTCSRCDYTTYVEKEALGHDEVAHEAQAPTCTEIGWDAYVTCSRCDYTTYVEKSALGHDEVAHEAKAPTCTEIGWDAYVTCSRCDYTTYAEKEALGHDEIEHEAQAPTCTEIGWDAYVTCSRCDYTTYVEKSALGHDEIEHEAKTPTCTEIGWDAYVTCSRCDYTTYVEKSALGHDEIEHEAKAPTCTEIGWDAYVTCSRCDYSTYVEKEALGHDEVAHEAQAPTCTEIGWDAYVTCSRCDYTTYVEKEALGHDEVAHDAKAPTCTEIGWDAYVTCSRCDYTTYAEKEALGHTETVVSGTATCTEAGLSESSYCSVCEETIVEAVEVDALGHDEVPHDAKAPTCTENGWNAYVTCTRCDYTTYEEIPSASAHDLVFKTVNYTCFGDGYTVKICTLCDYYEDLQYPEELKAPGHHTFDEENAVTVDPTCTEYGYTEKTCTAAYYLENADGILELTPCGVAEKYDMVDPLGHDYDWKTDEAATCTETGSRTGTCKREECGEVITEIIPITPHAPSEDAETVRGSGDNYCKLVIKCTLCDTVLQEDTKQGHRFEFQYDYVADEDICTTDSTGTKRCRNCNYKEENVLIAKATGHDPEIGTRIEPTCTTDGEVIISKCRTCGKTFDNEKFVVPATGHTYSGIATCTADVKCITCGEVVEEALGHDFTVHAAAYNTELDQFFCARCGATTDDALSTFNNFVNSIKKSYFLNTFNKKTENAPELIRFSKSSAKTTYSRFDFGIYTSAIKSLYESEMANTPDTYTPVRTSGTLKNMLPLTYTSMVSHLEASDIENIKVEKLNNVNVRDVLSAYSDIYSVGSTNYDLTAYKKVINKDVIKVTVDVKNESYSQIKDIPDSQRTSLEKILDLDIRDDIREFDEVDGKLILREEDTGDGYSIIMTMELRNITSDAKVTYYFAADTYEPIFAVYDADIEMDQTIDMTFRIGFFSLNGELDPLINTNYSYVYLFPNFFA